MPKLPEMEEIKLYILIFFIYAIADASFFILLGMFFSFGPLTTRASLQETGLLP